VKRSGGRAAGDESSFDLEGGPVRDQLTDVMTPAAGQILRSDGTGWAPSLATVSADVRSTFLLSAMTVWDPGVIPAGSQASVDIAVAGLLPTQSWVFDVTADISRQGLLVQAAVTTTGQVTIYAANLTGASVDLGTGLWRVYGWR
jgi:hypothetical protein